MVKAIFFDVDGTLLSHSINDIPASTLKALDALHGRYDGDFNVGVVEFLASKSW